MQRSASESRLEVSMCLIPLAERESNEVKNSSKELVLGDRGWARVSPWVWLKRRLGPLSMGFL